ncbi:hypothetical protein ACFLV5_04845 [Chloroflexota bacterium]
MQLYVGGLSDDTTEVDVEEIFPKVCLPNRSQLLEILSRENQRGGGYQTTQWNHAPGKRNCGQKDARDAAR